MERRVPFVMPVATHHGFACSGRSGARGIAPFYEFRNPARRTSSPGTGGFNYHDMPLWHSLIVEKFEADSGFFMTKALKLHVLLEQSALILLTRRRTLG